jgi:carbonic anhydrase
MKGIKDLIEGNRRWSERISAQNEHFFRRLAEQQSPKYLWIGCSDSRVPANQIVDVFPGEIFVHRNVANLVLHTDFNCLSVIQYAVDVLAVRHIIVCGHYGCGGVAAALKNERLGLISNWLRQVQDVAARHHAILETQSSATQTADRLCELNVIEQVANLCQTTILQSAWDRSMHVAVHGWIYGLTDGLIRELGMCVEGSQDLQRAYSEALEKIALKAV